MECGNYKLLINFEKRKIHSQLQNVVLNFTEEENIDQTVADHDVDFVLIQHINIFLFDHILFKNTHYRIMATFSSKNYMFMPNYS